VAKKSAFLVIFLLTLFENTLKYFYVRLPLRGQRANINRPQATDKSTFQFACPKLQRSKDLEPEGPVNEP